MANRLKLRAFDAAPPTTCVVHEAKRASNCRLGHVRTGRNCSGGSKPGSGSNRARLRGAEGRRFGYPLHLYAGHVPRQGCDPLRFAPCWHSSCVTLCSARDWPSVHSATGLLVMDGRSARQRTTPRRPPPSCVPCLISTMLLWSSVVSVESPSLAWAAVYECRDATGKTVLTDRPRSLHNCEMRSKGTASALTPPISSDRPSPPPNSPLPPTLPPEYQETSIDSLSAPNPRASSSPSTSAPCARGFNPLNPLSAPPCVQSDQPGAQPP